MTSDRPKLLATRQTLYLGQVERSRLTNRIKLIAARSDEGFWVPLPPAEFLRLPSDHHDLHHKMLVFLELDPKQHVTHLLTADTEIIRFLNHLASSVDKLAEEKNEIRLWRESLQFQSEEFVRRIETLEIREAEINCLQKEESS